MRRWRRAPLSSRWWQTAWSCEKPATQHRRAVYRSRSRSVHSKRQPEACEGHRYFRARGGGALNNSAVSLPSGEKKRWSVVTPRRGPWRPPPSPANPPRQGATWGQTCANGAGSIATRDLGSESGRGVRIDSGPFRPNERCSKGGMVFGTYIPILRAAWFESVPRTRGKSAIVFSE